jgi:hypothetical protein
MSAGIKVEFTWTEECGGHEPLTLTMSEEQLAKRDPEGTSLLSAKINFTGSKTLTLQAIGPGDDEYMCPTLVNYVWSYMKDGKLDVPAEVDGDDAERALEYFGFPERVITIPDEDPACGGKRLAYQAHREAMGKTPDIVAFVKKTLFGGKVGAAGAVFIVDDRAHVEHGPFGETLDVLISNYASGQKQPGFYLTRLGESYTKVDFATAFRLLGNESKTASALRAKVSAEVSAFGGLNVEWKKEYLAYHNVGEDHGHREYQYGYRFVLIVTVKPRSEESRTGIKKRKVAE